MSSRAAIAATALSEALVGVAGGVEKMLKETPNTDLGSLLMLLAVAAEDAAKLAIFLGNATEAWAAHAQAWAERKEGK